MSKHTCVSHPIYHLLPTEIDALRICKTYDSKFRTSMCTCALFRVHSCQVTPPARPGALGLRRALYTVVFHIMPNLVTEQIDALAAFAPTALPVISLYLNTQSDDHGRDHFASFIKKELHTRAKSFAPQSAGRASFVRDVDRIEKYLANELRPSTNGLALFACAGVENFFEAFQLIAPLERHEIYVDHQPHLYTLALVNKQFPRYAAVVADTDSARLFVFGLSTTISEDRVESAKLSRTQTGGWSQARYQRHMQNYHQHHAKEVLEVLDRVVRQEEIQYIVFAGDQVVIPILEKQLSPFLAAKVIDVLRLDIRTPERQVLEATLAAMRRQDARDDAEKIEQLIGDYRSGGLAVVGVSDVLTALSKGQVEEILLSTSLKQFRGNEEEQGFPWFETTSSIVKGDNVSETILAQARQTGARARLIEDAPLLDEVGGVGASLRYRN
jgi:peptide chain release factor subunit 1